MKKAMHLIVINSKGGVGKSTVVEYFAHELVRTGFVVSVSNTDQQQHVAIVDNQESDFYLYDTAGAFTEQNVTLLSAAGGLDSSEVKVIVPVGTGKNDRKEIPFMMSALAEYGISKEKIIFLITKARRHSKATITLKEYLAEAGVNYCGWTIPQLEDFAQGRHTSRTRSETSAILNEIVL